MRGSTDDQGVMEFDGEERENLMISIAASTAPIYVHVRTSINDSSLVWTLTPITSSCLIYRDGRIEI